MLSHKGNQDTGMLSYMELTDLDFIPRRMYYITHVPKGEVRGKHGHYKDQQYLFCVQGQIKITFVCKAKGTQTKILNGFFNQKDINLQFFLNTIVGLFF